MLIFNKLFSWLWKKKEEKKQPSPEGPKKAVDVNKKKSIPPATQNRRSFKKHIDNPPRRHQPSFAEGKNIESLEDEEDVPDDWEENLVQTGEKKGFSKTKRKEIYQYYKEHGKFITFLKYEIHPKQFSRKRFLFGCMEIPLYQIRGCGDNPKSKKENLPKAPIKAPLRRSKYSLDIWKEVERLYLHEKKPCAKISIIMKIPETTIYDYLRSKNLTRSSSEAQKTAQSPSPDDLKEMERLYNEGEFQKDISKKVGYSRVTVKKYLKESGVKLRTLSETQKIRGIKKKRKEHLPKGSISKEILMKSNFIDDFYITNSYGEKLYKGFGLNKDKFDFYVICFELETVKNETKRLFIPFYKYSLYKLLNSVHLFLRRGGSPHGKIHHEDTKLLVNIIKKLKLTMRRETKEGCEFCDKEAVCCFYRYCPVTRLSDLNMTYDVCRNCFKKFNGDTFNNKIAKIAAEDLCVYDI